METTMYLSKVELEAGFGHICQAPREEGMIKMIVRRPADNEREVVQSAVLDAELGLVGDNWKTRGSRHTPDGSAVIEAQVTLMNARVIELIAQNVDRWALAGDQLYVDLDLSIENLPAGTRLQVGSAVIEISAKPHTGCAKFSQRFGVEAHKFVNSKEGSPMRLRGVNARVVQGGEVRVGEVVRKI